MISALVIAPLILLAAIAATRWARPVPAALALALTLALTGVLMIALGAAFNGLVQFMVYVGGVAVLILFSLLVTRPEDKPEEIQRSRKSWMVKLAAALPAGAAIAAVIPSLPPVPETTSAPGLSLRDLGLSLFTTHAPAVLGVGVILTAVLIGAALIAMEHPPGEDETE
jgi:NADH-quinone oxidoreductase subunit J